MCIVTPIRENGLRQLNKFSPTFSHQILREQEPETKYERQGEKEGD